MISVTGSVHYSGIPALRNNAKSDFRKSMINLSHRHSESFVSESRNCDGSCVLRVHGTVLYGTRQSGLTLFQK